MHGKYNVKLYSYVYSCKKTGSRIYKHKINNTVKMWKAKSVEM
jgi:hypothetical protein